MLVRFKHPSGATRQEHARTIAADPPPPDTVAVSQEVSTGATVPYVPAPPADAPTIPGYRITGEIAKGCMGRVYAVIDLSLDREVAIKTLLPGANADLAEVLARLDTCGADAELLAIARRCLGANPEERIADSREVAAAVASYRAKVEARLRQAETEAAEALVREAEQRKRRRLDEGRPHHLAALKANPRHPTYRQFYNFNLMELARAHAGLLDPEEALRTAQTRRDTGWDPPADAYDAACALARCIPIVAKHEKLDADKRKEAVRFYGDEAMQLLRDALAKGFKDAVRMKKNSDLEPLRGREDFQKLLAELEKKLLPAKQP